jgi:hypothetical protein
MPYVQQSDLNADVPPDFQTQALDDDNDGVADAGLWDAIAQKVSDAIDAQIGMRYAVPLQPDMVAYPNTNGFPAIIVNAARILAAEKLYARRPMPQSGNPWRAQADGVRKQLDQIAAGTRPLDPEEQRQKPSASVITGRLQSVPQGARMAL